MLGRITVIQDDRLAVFVELEQPASFKVNDVVNISKKKKIRSLAQNSFYWCFLGWCIHRNGGALCDQGHWSSDGLHADIKAWFTDKHKHDFEIDKKFTTTILDKQKFSQYFEIVNKELMIEFFGIDTSGFFKAYEQFGRWVDYTDRDFKEFMDEQVGTLPF
jgi:hypothetical protein